jgi:hypothetical protein
METENCNPPKVDDWSEVSILEVVLSAQDGIPGAKAELARREKEGQKLDKGVTNTQPELLHGEKDIDTVSAKALDLSQIRVEWIEE